MHHTRSVGSSYTMGYVLYKWEVRVRSYKRNHDQYGDPLRMMQCITCERMCTYTALHARQALYRTLYLQRNVQGRRCGMVFITRI